MDPLIVAGDSIVPLLLERVKNRDMPRRRYAIAFFGNGAYREALPVLGQILTDSNEDETFRGDALEAIYRIDQPLGIEKARQYAGDPSFVGQSAKRVLDGRICLDCRRSYWDAKFSGDLDN